MRDLINSLSEISNRYLYNSSAIRAIIQMIIDQEWSSLNYNKILEEYHVRRNSVELKKDSLSVAIEYAKMCLADDALTEEEIKGMTFLKRMLYVEEGDFYQYGFKDQVKAIITQQLCWMYNDGVINEEEAIHKVELQGLFNLSYNEFDDIVHEIAQECLEKGARIQDLDTNIPFVLYSE